MDVIKLGIIGLGNMGSSHCGFLLRGEVPGIEITAVADRKELRRDWAKEELPVSVEIFSEGADLIEEGTCDAILIAVPHYQHPELAIAGFQKGLHVMCEKPAGVYTRQVQEMNREAKKHDVVFAMMFNQRTNCIYRKMHKMIKDGELGEIRRVNWIVTDWYRSQFYYDSGAWRATWDGEGGGVLLNQCPHNLDLLQWICGMPVKVRAFCHEGKWHDIEVEDDVTAYLEYENGATGVFITSTGDLPGTNRFEITGDKGKLVCENEKLFFSKLSVDNPTYTKAAKDGFSQPECESFEVQTDGENPQHVGVLRAFAGNILRGEPLIAKGEEGIYGLTLSNAMHLSSWLEKDVTIPFDEELFYSELEKKRAASHRKEERDIILDTTNSY